MQHDKHTNHKCHDMCVTNKHGEAIVLKSRVRYV